MNKFFRNLLSLFGWRVGRGRSSLTLSSGGTISINGTTYKGNNLTITDGEVFIDGKPAAGWERKDKNDVTINGDVIAMSGLVVSITVNGDVYGGVDTTGNVQVGGNVDGNVDTTGNVSVGGDVGGKIDTTGAVTVSGDVHGNVDTVGAVKCTSIDGRIISSGSVAGQ